MSTTLHQDRAADALKKALDVSKLNPKLAGKYRSYVDGLPAAIVINGLGQALAMELSGGGGTADAAAHRHLFDHVASWLATQIEAYTHTPARSILQDMMSKDEALYLHAQAEALAWLNWHKKFCRAYLPEGEED